MSAKPKDPAAARLLGAKIRRARSKQHLTGEDVQRLAGINPTSLSFFERGIREPSPTQLLALSRVLRVRFVLDGRLDAA